MDKTDGVSQRSMQQKLYQQVSLLLIGCLFKKNRGQQNKSA